MPKIADVAVVRTQPSTYRFVRTADEDVSQHFGCRNVESWNACLADSSEFPQWLLDENVYGTVTGLCCHNHQTVLVYA